MKRLLILLLCLVLTLPMAACSEPDFKDTYIDTEDTTPKEPVPVSLDLRIMTCNVWEDQFNNPIPGRDQSFITLFGEYKPDVVGLQEYNANWYKSPLLTAYPDTYETIEAYEGNFVPLVYNKEKFTVVEKGYYDYPDTPDVSKGITWAVLEDKETGLKFGVLSTHFWASSGTEGQLARLKSALDLVNQMTYITETYGCPAFSMGDFNSRIDSNVIEYILGKGVLYLYDHAAEHDDKAPGIDHIFGLGDIAEVKAHHAVRDSFMNGASDHAPVYVDVVIKGTK